MTLQSPLKVLIITITMIVHMTFTDAATAQDLRVATYNVSLTRKGPGLLLRDILGGKDDQVLAVLDVIKTLSPDVLLLQNLDHDLQNHTLKAFQNALSDAGYQMKFAAAPPPNTGVATGVDMDGNGYADEARDAQSFGRFQGEGGMAILSKYPIGQIRDFSSFLWKSLPHNIAPQTAGLPFPSQQAFDIQRLSTVAHWDVEIILPKGAPLRLLAFHATPPVFDGDEDQNGRRNHDEILFWRRYLDNDLPFTPPSERFIIAGDANLDPHDAEGRHEAIRTLLSDPRLQDINARRPTGESLSYDNHTGDPLLDTVDWEDPIPGNLRVSYLLAHEHMTVLNAGVFWPAQTDPMYDSILRASPHRLVWADVQF